MNEKLLDYDNDMEELIEFIDFIEDDEEKIQFIISFIISNARS